MIGEVKVKQKYSKLAIFGLAQSITSWKAGRRGVLAKLRNLLRPVN